MEFRSIARRLTPLESERLMGFPDGYTAIDGDATPDAPRYKACGNSWGINCAEWVTERIDLVDRLLGNRGLANYATVCSGVEAQSLAFRAAGIDAKPVFFSEIEPFPCRVLAARYPEVPNLGDMTKIKVTEKEITNGTVTIARPGELALLSGGTPCQDYSIAGLRAGGSREQIGETRSSLAFVYIDLLKALRPRWILWENVPGVLSSNGGRDFAGFLREVHECGYRSLAYRVLDVQYTRTRGFPMAIPQRRRRVWVVGYSGEDRYAAPEVLFEQASLRGDTPPSRVTGKGFARPVSWSAAGADPHVE